MSMPMISKGVEKEGKEQAQAKGETLGENLLIGPVLKEGEQFSHEERDTRLTQDSEELTKGGGHKGGRCQFPERRH
jgi:nucleoid-associated protein YgaU